MTYYPDVPNVPGVPKVLRNPANLYPELPRFISQDTVNLPAVVNPPMWGIYLDGVQVVQPDNIVSLDYKQEYTLSNYPIEGGAFETYDKVYTPFDVKLVLSVGGSQGKRQQFLNSINNLLGTPDNPNMNLYDVVAPDAIFKSCNVIHQDYKRTASAGMGLITVSLDLIQVLVVAAPQFTQTQSQTNTTPANSGIQKTEPVQPSLLKKGANAISSFF